MADKARLWKELKEIIETKDGVWILMGDFNAVRRPEERFNSVFCQRTARDFNEFIRDSGLMEPKMGGFRFTCFRDADTKLSKLDRFLHSPCFLDIAFNVTVTTLPRELSDHCPILLSNSR